MVTMGSGGALFPVAADEPADADVPFPVSFPSALFAGNGLFGFPAATFWIWTTSLADVGSWRSSDSFLTLIFGGARLAAAFSYDASVAVTVVTDAVAVVVFFFCTNVTLTSLPRPISDATFDGDDATTSFVVFDAAFAVAASSNAFDFSTIVTLTPDAKSRDVSSSCCVAVGVGVGGCCCVKF